MYFFVNFLDDEYAPQLEAIPVVHIPYCSHTLLLTGIPLCLQLSKAFGSALLQVQRKTPLLGNPPLLELIRNAQLFR